MQYRAEIDGLRALAVIPVIVYHADINLMPGGFIGVDVFFVISGYLITSIILAELEKGTFSLLTFYERRARRILPALFFVMVVSIPLAWALLPPDEMKYFSLSLAAVATFSSNILFWRESIYYDLPAAKALAHTWSLAVEEQYYLLFPLFMLIAWQFGKRWIIAILAVAAILSLGAAHWGALYKPNATFHFYLLPTRGWELLIGVFVAFQLSKQEAIRGNQVLSVLGIAMILFSMLTFDETTPFPSLYALIPTLGVALVILFTSPTTFAYRLLSSKILVGIGLVSYSAYLWHLPIFIFARQMSLSGLSAGVNLALALATGVMAYISWRFVERPFRTKGVISRAQVVRLSFLFSAMFIIFGVYGYYTNGKMAFASNIEAQSR